MECCKERDGSAVRGERSFPITSTQKGAGVELGQGSSYTLKIPFIRNLHKTQAGGCGHTGKTEPELGHIHGQQDRANCEIHCGMKKQLLSGAWGGLIRGRQMDTHQSLHVAGPLEQNRTARAGAGEPAGIGEPAPCSGLGVVWGDAEPPVCDTLGHPPLCCRREQGQLPCGITFLLRK